MKRQRARGALTGRGAGGSAPPAAAAAEPRKPGQGPRRLRPPRAPAPAPLRPRPAPGSRVGTGTGGGPRVPPGRGGSEPGAGGVTASEGCSGPAAIPNCARVRGAAGACA